MTRIIVATLFLAATLVSAQTSKPSHSAPTPHATTNAIDMNAVWADELPNMKSDLAELRSMLNVLASQESSMDMRTSAAIQTNRKMWQVVIARLAELTQRMEALERAQNSNREKQ